MNEAVQEMAAKSEVKGNKINVGKWHLQRAYHFDSFTSDLPQYHQESSEASFFIVKAESCIHWSFPWLDATSTPMEYGHSLPTAMPSMAAS
jgi:hypothetical protein